ncbi:hypothetical protein BDA99DRAFT_443748, partial [Phascolomyces articulosus]
GHEQEVHDVSWAPSMARTYQLIATASKDHFMQIELVVSFNDYYAEVWRVEWNVTGSILSFRDGDKIQLRKAGSDDVWRQMTAISANQHHSFAS